MNQKNYNKLKQEVEELRDLPGKQRGEHIKYFVRYIKEKKGEAGLKKIKKTLKEMDFDIGDVEQLRNTEWIPESIPHIFFAAAIRVFDWGEKEAYEMGETSMPRSSITKMFLKYFTSVEKTLKKGVKQWNNHFTRGSLEIKELDKKNKKGVLLLKDFRTHPLACAHFRGFFTRILEIITGSGQVEFRETKCMNQGDEYHEFHFQW